MEYLDKLDKDLTLIDHYALILMTKLESITILYDILDKLDILNRKGYPYYLHEYNDPMKRDIALFQRKPELFTSKPFF